MTEFKLPELGENIDQGDLVRLMVSLGASVTEGQPVMELETDKAVVEVPSSVTGTVKEIRVKEGQKVKVGQVIFTVENGAGAKVKASKPRASRPRRSPKPPAAKAPAEKSAPMAKAAAAAATEARPAAPASPAPVATGAADFRLPELGENIDQGDLVRLMISPGSQSFRRPARHGTGNRQGRGRSAIVGDRHGERDQGQGRRKSQSRPGDFHSRGRGFGAGESEALHRSSTSPNNTKLDCRCRPRSRPRARPRPRYFFPISLSRMLPKLFPCRSSWAKWQEPSIARLLPPRLTFVAWREKSASIFTRSRATVPADASAKTM